ncbi:MAG: hypothetical protein HC859_13950, partial [Bacteroidia bacterium]|nr:hypothetical protein [Bacteroidia bacterium]
MMGWGIEGGLLLAPPRRVAGKDGLKEIEIMAEVVTKVTKEIVGKFIDSRTGSVQRTLVAYRTALMLMVTWEIPIDNDVLRAFDYALAKRTFKKVLRDKSVAAALGKLKTVSLKYSDTTRRLYVTALKQFLYWLDAEELAPIEFNRTKAEDRLRASRGKRSRTTYQHRSPDQDLMRIVEYFDQSPAPPSHERDAPRRTLELLRNRALMHLLRCTGGRVSEVLSLKRVHVQDGRLDEVRIYARALTDDEMRLLAEVYATASPA